MLEMGLDIDHLSRKTLSCESEDFVETRVCQVRVIFSYIIESVGDFDSILPIKITPEFGEDYQFCSESENREYP